MEPDVKLPKLGTVTQLPNPFYGYPLYGSNGRLLYGKSGRILYASEKYFTEYMLDLFWEWTWGGDDNTINALLNGNNVCTHHSKSHIITYNVGKVGGVFNYGGSGIVTATCVAGWQANPYSYGGDVRTPPSSVNIRCWVTLMGVRREVSGTNSLTVNVKIDLNNRKWEFV